MKKTWILLAVIAVALPGSVLGQEKETPPPKGAPGDLETRVAALEKQIAALSMSIAALNQKLGGGTMELELPKPDGTAGTERKAMRPVTDGAPTSGANGRLIITNYSGYDQYLYINCRLWRVVPGKSYASVPRGNVIVQRPGDAAQTLSDWKAEADGTHVVRYTYPRTATVTVLSPVIIWP